MSAQSLRVKSKRFTREPTAKQQSKNKSSKSYFGRQGESLACEYLKNHGYKVIKRNFRLKFGEIDIIATKDNLLWFFEVKTRWSHKYGLPEEAVNKRKLSKIKKLAEYYASRNSGLPQKLRVEVVAIEILPNGKNEIRILDTY